ncbi:hypothetical protein PVK06_000475 [Gossypium arboreum]|uniref:Uncharacterized protein n=1 Tax=Gossypium arboreum TaxID=29729 RepID=A0ABR0QZG8_GOSAR|nr:hypothetical protein PVK06_000475 [Gossypium arboreum]
MQHILNNNFGDWNILNNYSHAQNGRIWVLWKSPVNLSFVADTDQNSPWLLGDDFNVIANPYESSNTSQVVTRDMTEYRDCILEIGVLDHPYSGSFFTWSNHTLYNKLDRMLINHLWFSYSSNFIAEFIAPEVSDHYLCYSKDRCA